MLSSSNTNINFEANINLEGQSPSTTPKTTSNNNLQSGFLLDPFSHNVVNNCHDFANINTSLEKPDLAAQLDRSLLMDLNFEIVMNEASTCGEVNGTDGATKFDSSPKKAGKKRKKNEEGENNEKKKSKSNNQRRNIKKLITEDKLNENTLRALNEEKERQERLNNATNSKSEVTYKISQTSCNPMMTLHPQRQIQAITPLSNLVSVDESLDYNDDLKMNDFDLLSEAIAPPLPHELLTTPRTFKSELISISTPAEAVNALNSSSDQSVCIIEEESNFESSKKKPVANQSINNETVDVIELVDDADDDNDCMIISESEHLQEDQAANKRKLRGIHMNDELNRPDANGQVLINVNHPAEDPDICLLPYIAKHAKTHQIGGIRFMYDNIVESLTRIENKKTGFGCILAHAMGLGKTFQVISFIEIVLRCTTAQRVLCIVPINTIQNWQSEFNNWLPENGQHRLDQDTLINYKRPFKVHTINDFAKTLKQRTEIILEWRNRGGVLLIGYEMFRTLVQNSTTSKQMKNQKKLAFSSIGDTKPAEFDDRPELAKMSEIQVALLTPDLVVCDEGHRIKNNMANIAKTLQKIATKRRVVLTGYPLQNNLTEYWCMVDFVRPSYLGTKAEFSNMFERPIMNGQCVDSTREDVKLMRYRAHVLHSLLEGFVQRRGHDVFYGQLTLKQEYIVLLKMSPMQKELYLAFMEAIGAMSTNEKANPLRSFAICCKIWNHPDVLYKYVVDKSTEIDIDLPDIPLKDSKESKPKPGSLTKSNSSSSLLYTDSESQGGFNPFAYQPDRRSQAGFDPDWANRIINERYEPNHLENGAKFVLALELIHQSILVGDKILLFSQSLLSLDLFEKYLHQTYVANTSELWTKYKHYYRLDGSTSGVERERLINAFNKSNSEAWLFLLSTRAGCLGINLVGANRVIVLDASWNPCHDAQAVCRVYRYGQKKTCFIYRLVADHTMEKKIYDRQVSKQTMADRVVDEIQADSLFTKSEVEKLIHYVLKKSHHANTRVLGYLDSESEEINRYQYIDRCIHILIYQLLIFKLKSLHNDHMSWLYKNNTDWRQKEDAPSADLSDMPEKFDDQVLIAACMKHSSTITKEPFTHESLLIDKKEYQLSEREKNLAFRDYHHDKKYFPTSRPSSLSQFYQRTSLSLPPVLVNNGGYSNYIAPQINPNINYSALSSLNSNYNSSSNSSATSLSTGGYSCSSDKSLAKSELDFNLNSNTRDSFHSRVPKAYNNSPTIMNCLNTTQQEQHQKPQFNITTSANSNNSQNLRDVKISRFIVASKIVIPASAIPVMPSSERNLDNSFNEPMVIQPGQQVYLLTSAKGTFLRTPDKKYVTLTDEIYSKLTQSISQNLQQPKQEQPVSFITPPNDGFGPDPRNVFYVDGNFNHQNAITAPTSEYNYENSSGQMNSNGFNYSYGNEVANSYSRNNGDFEYKE